MATWSSVYTFTDINNSGGKASAIDTGNDYVFFVDTLAASITVEGIKRYDPSGDTVIELTNQACPGGMNAPPTFGFGKGPFYFSGSLLYVDGDTFAGLDSIYFYVYSSGCTWTQKSTVISGSGTARHFSSVQAPSALYSFHYDFDGGAASSQRFVYGHKSSDAATWSTFPVQEIQNASYPNLYVTLGYTPFHPAPNREPAMRHQTSGVNVYKRMMTLSGGSFVEDQYYENNTTFGASGGEPGVDSYVLNSHYRHWLSTGSYRQAYSLADWTWVGASEFDIEPVMCFGFSDYELGFKQVSGSVYLYYINNGESSWNFLESVVHDPTDTIEVTSAFLFSDNNSVICVNNFSSNWTRFYKRSEPFNLMAASVAGLRFLGIDTDPTYVYATVWSDDQIRLNVYDQGEFPSGSSYRYNFGEVAATDLDDKTYYMSPTVTDNEEVYVWGRGASSQLYRSTNNGQTFANIAASEWGSGDRIAQFMPYKNDDWLAVFTSGCVWRSVSGSSGWEKIGDGDSACYTAGDRNLYKEYSILVSACDAGDYDWSVNRGEDWTGASSDGQSGSTHRVRFIHER